MADLIGHVGADRILFSTDFPHPDHDVDVLAPMVALENHLPAQVIADILWQNPRRFYGLKTTLD